MTFLLLPVVLGVVNDCFLEGGGGDWKAEASGTTRLEESSKVSGTRASFDLLAAKKEDEFFC